MRLGKEQAVGYVEDTAISDNRAVEAPVVAEVKPDQPLTTAAEPVLPVG